MAQYNPFNPTSQTWSQIANKQAATEMQSGALNSNELICSMTRFIISS